MNETIGLICVVCWKHIDSLEAEFFGEHSKEEAAELYIREFQISRMCKRCQDQVFADPEENNLPED